MLKIAIIIMEDFINKIKKRLVRQKLRKTQSPCFGNLLKELVNL